MGSIPIGRTMTEYTENITIQRTSCRCGGNWAWLQEKTSGAWEMIGCICHNTAPENNNFMAIRQDDLNEIDEMLAKYSIFIDAKLLNKNNNELVVTMNRIAKVAEELGEVNEALVMATGGHRREDGLTMENVADELLDVAGAALMAHMHLMFNIPGNTMSKFVDKLNKILLRAGL